MWYKVEFPKLTVLLLPTFLRKPKIIAFVQCLISPINELYYEWHNWRIDNIYKLEHTGQVCSLRGSLNDRFDPLERRIYIGDGQQNETTYIHTEAEAQELFTNTENEDNDETMYVYTESETADSGLDFIVYVPISIVNTEIHALKAHIEFYKAGGKRYAIISF